MPRNNWTKPEWYPVRFSSRPQQYRPHFTKIFKILEICQRRLHMLCRPRESIRQASSWKALGSVAECGVDGRPVMFDGRVLVKLTQFWVRLVALWSQNGSFQTPQSCRFSTGLCSDAYLWSSILGNDRKNVNSGGSTKDHSPADRARELFKSALNGERLVV